MAIIRGNVEEAITLCDQKYPDVLEKNYNLLFRLRCRKFIDMVYKGQQKNKMVTPSTTAAAAAAATGGDDPMEVDSNHTSIVPVRRQHAGTKRRRRSNSTNSNNSMGDNSSSNMDNNHHLIVPDQDDIDVEDDDDDYDGFENDTFKEIMMYGQQLQQEYGTMVEQRPEMKQELMVMIRMEWMNNLDKGERKEKGN